ncbi:MAG: cytidylate kinase-like family protein [Clostridia bacterium]|jgi:cytidylate kinase|nr:cytidylate kinase-like family protein [Clostridia bacterium]
MNNLNFVITIGREYGSGGREIGRQVAEKLRIPFYDKELIAASVRESGMDAKVFEELEERTTPSFLFSLAVGSLTPNIVDGNILGFSLNDRVNDIQAETIKKLAAKSSCVIVGRAADDILAKDADCLNVFIHAPLDARIARSRNDYGLQGDYEELKNTILKIDKRRANYYSYITSKSWGDASNYHLSLNSSHFGISGCVQMILEAAALQRPEFAKK